MAYCFLVFAWYWTMQVPVTVANMAAAGAAASWYFVTHEHNPVGKAVRRALTTSFGVAAARRSHEPHPRPHLTLPACSRGDAADCSLFYCQGLFWVLPLRRLKKTQCPGDVT